MTLNNYYHAVPDLIVHHSFYGHLCNLNGLERHFNLMTVSHLTVHMNSQNISLIYPDGEVVDKCLELEPHYGRFIGTGVRPHITSYSFENNMQMYSLGERAPRYVIWTVDEPTPVCATILARTDMYGLMNAVNTAVEWSKSRRISKTSSVVVFDLDETLIDGKDRVFDGALSALEYARVTHDIMVLWSHGSALHVDKHVANFSTSGVNFDLVLCNAQNSEKSCKNLLYLYNYFTDTYFTKAVLIDDSVFNWTPEYTHLVVPTNQNSIKHVTRVLEKLI